MKMIFTITFCVLAVACQPSSSTTRDFVLDALDCKIQIPDGYRLSKSDGFIHGSFLGEDTGLHPIFQYDPNHSLRDHASENNIYYQVVSEEQTGNLSFLKVILEPEIESGLKFDVITNGLAFFATPAVSESIFLSQFEQCAGNLANK